MAHNYDVGTRAWQPDSTEGWVASEVVSKEIQEDKVKLLFRLDNDEVCDTIAILSLVFALRILICCYSDKNIRNDIGGSPRRCQQFVTPSHESRHTRSQR